MKKLLIFILTISAFFLFPPALYWLFIGIGQAYSWYSDFLAQFFISNFLIEAIIFVLSLFFAMVVCFFLMEILNIYKEEPKE